MARTANSSQGYNGNPNLPLPSEEYAFTGEEFAEYVKCKSNPIYFISTYVKITNVDDGIVKFNPWDFQKDIITTLEANRFVIAKLPRQCGKSTVIICGYFLWYVLFHTDVSVALLANKEETAIMLLDRFKQSFELLPRFLKQGIEKWDQMLVKFGNKARVRAAATSGSAIRGDSFNIVFLDEFAFVPANIAVDFMSSVFPVISSGRTTKLFIVSTPNGYNLFYKLFTEATQGKNSYKSLAYTWRDVFFARHPHATEQEAMLWREDTIRNMGNNLQQFAQEFECDFLGSANTLVGPWKLAQLSYIQPSEIRGSLRIYKKPIHLSDAGPAHVYCACVDVAQGQEQDSSVIQVVDITTNPFEQVAVYQDKSIKPAQLATVCVDVARWYNEAFLFFEINGEALATAQLCHEEMEYTNLIYIFMHKKKGQQISGGFHERAKFGLKSSEATKRIGCTGLKSLVENDKLLIRDYETMQQMTTFVGKLNKRGLATVYEAEIGNHDDCISPLVLLGWLTLQQRFEDYVGLSMRKLLMDGAKNLPILEEPFVGFIDPNAGHVVVGQGPQGVDIVDDNDFWL
jgi:hypothetical protein